MKYEEVLVSRCPSVRPSVCLSVRPQDISRTPLPILTKFGGWLYWVIISDEFVFGQNRPARSGVGGQKVARLLKIPICSQFKTMKYIYICEAYLRISKAADARSGQVDRFGG